MCEHLNWHVVREFQRGDQTLILGVGVWAVQDLQQLADGFNNKRKQGLAQAHSSGYGGTGYKFDENEEDKRKAERKVSRPQDWSHLGCPCLDWC